MPYNKLEKLWEGTKLLRNLKWMDLSYAEYLKELPDLSTATKLEELVLQHCSSLLELPSSLGNAINLKILNLRNCSSLLELPSSIGNAINLEILNLLSCSRLRELPSSIGNAINLQELDLRGCSSLLELPSSIGNAINLQKVSLQACSNLVELPSSIMNMTNLEELELEGCSSLVKLPFSLGNAINLQNLNLSHCTSLGKIPSSIENTSNLQYLDLSNCSNLVELPSIGNATKLEQLNLRDCSNLVKLSSSINASNLKELCLHNCSLVVELPAIENATNLQILYLLGCSSLLELPPSIRSATNLQILNISGCSSLVILPSSIGDLINLRTFDLCDCSSLVELPSSIGNLQKLDFLLMCGCSKLEALPTNINLESLRLLDLTDCSHALDIITHLYLVNEDKKEIPPWVKEMSRLRKLRLYNCDNLVSLPQLSDSLSDLVAENCQSLERLECFFNNPEIRLEFVNCLKLNQKARDLIMHTSTLKYAIEPGTEVPACFNHRARAGGSLTIKLNESTLPTSLRFKACVMLVKDEEESGDDQSHNVSIDVSYKQNDLKGWCLGGRHYIDRRLFIEHIYTFEVEAKEVTSTELVFQFGTQYSMFAITKCKWKIGECGLLQIKKEESEN